MAREKQMEADSQAMKPILEASGELSAAASRATQALQSLALATLEPARAKEMNRAIASFEQALLAPEGLPDRPWYEHTIFAPGSFAGYDAELFPGVAETLDRGDPALLRQQCDALAAALRRAAARLDEIARLAQPPPSPAAGHR